MDGDLQTRTILVWAVHHLRRQSH